MVKSSLTFSLRSIALLIINDFLFRCFPKYHQSKFLPWIESILGHPLYTQTDRTIPPTVLLILGHPSPLIDLSRVKSESQIIEEWNHQNILECNNLTHFIARLLLNHIISKLSKEKLPKNLQNQFEQLCANDKNNLAYRRTTRQNAIPKSSQHSHDLPVEIQLIQVRGTPLQSSTLFPNGLVLVKSTDLIIRYREAYLQPIDRNDQWMSYFTNRWPIGDGRDDEAMVHNLIKQSIFMIFIYPVLWYSVPAPIKSLLDKTFTAEFFKLLPAHSLVSGMTWWLGRVTYPIKCVRRRLCRYISHGLLRDKAAAIIETLGGFDPIYLGHCQNPLETTLSYCGIHVTDVVTLDRVAMPDFSAWKKYNAVTTKNHSSKAIYQKQIKESYWFDSFNSKAIKTAKHVVEFVRAINCTHCRAVT